jgi:YegS/Rv2252/BmrU family lipid kinase
MSRRPYFIANPNSSGGRTAREWPAIEARLRKELGDIGVGMTQAPEDATRLAREALHDGYDLIVAVGGDGTNNEVVNGFFENGRPVNPEAAFGLFQRGTGGDFKRTLGLAGTQDEYVAALRGNGVRRIDVGKLTYVDHNEREATRYFLNIASFGIGGLFDIYLNRSRKVFPGRFATTWAGLRAGLKYKNQPVRISIDGGSDREVRINNVAVANGRYYGGAMFVAPAAELDDGLFEVVVIGDLKFGELLTFSRRIYKGTHLTMPKIECQRGRVVRATSDEIVLLDVDGEQPGKLPATFEVVPGVLQLKVAG